MTDNQPRYTTKRLHDEMNKAREYGRMLEREAMQGQLSVKTLEAETMREASIKHAQERNAAEARVLILEDVLRAMLPENNRSDEHCRPNFETCERARIALSKSE